MMAIERFVGGFVSKEDAYIHEIRVSLASRVKRGTKQTEKLEQLAGWGEKMVWAYALESVIFLAIYLDRPSLAILGAAGAIAGMGILANRVLHTRIDDHITKAEETMGLIERDRADLQGAILQMPHSHFMPVDSENMEQRIYIEHEVLERARMPINPRLN